VIPLHRSRHATGAGAWRGTGRSIVLDFTAA
jgi:hypothetical protein